MGTVPILGLAAIAPALAALAGCGSGAAAPVSGGVVQVVAAENFWGSIAAQLGGAHAHVASVISNPDTDPHAYEPTPQDARAVAQAQYVILNGAGYDPWAQKLVDADGSVGPTALSIAALAGRKEGDNPHMWYSPPIVMKAVQRISADLARLDPNDAAYFAQQAQRFTTTSLARYDELRAHIKARYAGTHVGATENIVVDLAADLGLDLLTPPAYMKAVAEGEDPTAQDRATVDGQIDRRLIRVLVVNSQNSTPDIQALMARASAHRIPVVTVTETLDPQTATFQDWQADQLSALEQALQKASA